MAHLLVSVRSAFEAEEAFAGGAEIIDIKEPDAGALGKAQDGVCRDVLAFVAGQRAVSAAMGELLDAALPPAGMRLQFVKWGLAGCALRGGWRARAVEIAASLSLGLANSAPVFVAYADHCLAGSPPVLKVAHWCVHEQMPVLMIDTFSKTGKTLLDWLSLEQLSSIAQLCSNGGVRLALAGSLGAHEINALVSMPVDWIGIRGAACKSGKRGGVIDRQRVARLAKCFQRPRNSTIADSRPERIAVSQRAACAPQ